MRWSPWYGTRWGWLVILAFVAVAVWAFLGVLLG